MTMKPEFKKVWVDALRSGEFKQAQGMLMNSRGACCCLGVACLAWQRTLLPEIETEIGDTSFYTLEARFRGEGRTTRLPFTLEAFVGLNEASGSILVDMNDGQNKSFAEIADYIEANL